MTKNIEEKCIAKGVKLTDQRKVIAKVMSNSDDHPNVDELYKRVSKLDSKILSTYTFLLQLNKSSNKYNLVLSVKISEPFLKPIPSIKKG